MKIAQVVSNFPPYFGGIGNACMRISEELIRLGNELEVYTSSYPNVEYTYPDGLKVNRLKHQIKYRHATLLLGIFKIKNTDVIQLHLPFFFGGEIVYLLSLFRDIKYTVTYQTDLVGTGMIKIIFSLHRMLILKRILKRAEVIYVSSMDYANHSFLRDIDGIEHKILEMPIGVDANRFNPKNIDPGLKKRLNIKPNVPIVLFVAALDKPHYSKGLSQLLCALKEAGTPGELLVVGDGDLKSHFEMQASKLGISQLVHFAGRVSDDDLPKYYGISDIFVLPSTDKTEAYGMVTLEAMASGKAVIVSNLPGVRTLVDQGRSGLLVNPGDVNSLANALKVLLSDKTIRDEFGTRGRKIAENRYNWQTIGKELNTSLTQVINKSGT